MYHHHSSTSLISTYQTTTFLICLLFRLFQTPLQWIERLYRQGEAPYQPQATQRRLAWGRRVQRWTVQNHWSKVFFSDEFRVTLFKCDGRTTVWREGRERYAPACLKPHRSQSRAGIMFWGCIGYGAPGHLVEVQNNVNRHVYINVLVK